MCKSDDCIKILNENMSRIQSEFGVTGLCIFGSVARGDNRPDSDVDILVDMPPKIFMMSALKAFLEKILHTSVDIIRRHSHLSPQFIKQISRDAITIF
ncbi:MAG: nucleotidyltransferase domain-containing protein [Duncaniella sp.]|nr:nucleotidyltransferase domain-containing protein [Duncaniella sp.]